ncbi:TPA: terminase small subunit [Escherichia coli]|nr:terminase small subunit [Escherichia coli]EFJ6999667.1 terminase small subunit [Escherichia coli]EFJ7033230.1 terminase small subunit [Escherichia coli]MBE8972916.1 terminase small subunit [Escherichia coli]HAH9775654.1 terminase small subunit [Escherichia coli]
MEVNKKQLADIFGASIRTIQNWQEQGMPVLRGGGKGNEVLYDSAAVIKWYAERDAEIENEKLRREVEELRQASEADLQPGTIEYERHRLTRAQADAQELKNARDSAEVVETAFCTFVLSRIAGEIASILDGIPLSVQRRFPELENRHVDFLKRDIIKAMNKAAALDELIVPLPRQRQQAIPRRRQRRPRQTPGLLKRQRDRAPRLRQAQKQRLRRLPVQRQQVPGRPQPVPPPPENRQKVPHRLLQQPQRRLAKPLNRPAQQRGLLPQRRHPRRTRKRRKPAQNPQKRLPHRPPVRRRHRHHRRLLQKMRRPDKRPQRRAAPRQHPRRRQRQLAVRRRQHRAKVRRNPRQRAPRQRQNGQRILHPPWRLRMRARRKRG